MQTITPGGVLQALARGDGPQPDGPRMEGRMGRGPQLRDLAGERPGDMSQERGRLGRLVRSNGVRLDLHRRPAPKQGKHSLSSIEARPTKRARYCRIVRGAARGGLRQA